MEVVNKGCSGGQFEEVDVQIGARKISKCYIDVEWGSECSQRQEGLCKGPDLMVKWI